MLLVIIARRGLHRRFPFFSAYTFYSILATAAQMATRRDPETFFVVYWSTETIYAILALLAIWEVFKSILETYPRWIPGLALSSMVAIPLWRALYHHPVGPTLMAYLGTGAQWFMLGVLILEASVFAICLWLGYRNHNPVRWQRYERGILVGFGIAATGAAPMYLARFSLGPAMDLAFRHIPQIVYVAATLTWLKAFYREEPPIDPQLLDRQVYRRAAEAMRKAVEGVEKDLGLRRSLPL